MAAKIYPVMLIIFLGIICLPTYHAFPYYPSEFYYILFGNFSNMEDLLLPDDNTPLQNITDMPNTTLAEILTDDTYNISEPENIAESFKTPIASADGPDTQLFDKLNFNVYNFTRKYFWHSHREYHWGDKDPFDHHIPWHKRDEHEKLKRFKVRQLAFQLMMHARHKISFALKQRESVRMDKRYKIGYLFSRARRIHTEMLKVIAMAFEEERDFRARRFLVNMRFYVEVTRMDQDIRDTIRYIKEIHEYNSPQDFALRPTTHKWGS